MALEYPESTCIAGQMRQVLPGHSVAALTIRDASSAVFRWGFSNLDAIDLTGQCIQAVRQFGDFIFIEMDAYSLMFGDMIGKILYHRPGEKRPAKPAILVHLDDGAAFSYNPSLYGYCRALTPAEAAQKVPTTWVQPFDDTFTPDYLAQAFAEPERKIAKQMNIFNVKYKAAGVGIGYWQEVLYRCGVHPQRKSAQITPAEIERLHACTRQVLCDALAQGGSTDEVDFFNQRGGYVRSMSGRMKGQPCPACGAPIQGKNILGANVYFCPTCQI